MIKRGIIILNLFLGYILVNAQEVNTLYFMDRVPQASQLNPAFQPKCNFFFGMPGFSTVKFDVGNSSLKLTDFLSYNSQLDSLITFLHPKATIDQRNKVYNALKSENSLFANFQEDIITFGFRVSSWYFTFGSSIKSDLSFTYPKDLAKLMLYGIDTVDQFNLAKLGINANLYTEMSFGLSKAVNDALTVGARVKFINGLANLTNSNQQLLLTSSVQGNQRIFTLGLDANAKINGSFPYMKMPKDGPISADSLQNFKQDTSLKSNDYIKNRPANYGLGFDLGVTYTGIDKFVLSASVVDLGFIKWKTGVFNLSANGSFKYSGPSIDLLNKKDSLDIIKKMTDSLKNQVKFTKTSSSYTTSLPTKIYLGVEYYPVHFLSFGLLSLTELYNSQIYQQVMVSANLKPLQMLTFSTSYSFFDNGFSNIGVGMNLRLAPIDFYIIADNIPLYYAKYGGAPIPSRTQSFILRMGIDFVFGCNPNKKLKDKPLLME